MENVAFDNSQADAALAGSLLSGITPPLEETELPPVTTETFRNNRQVGNPNQTSQKTGPRRIKEFLAGELLPLQGVMDIFRFQLCRLASGEIRIDKIRTLRNIDLFMISLIYVWWQNKVENSRICQDPPRCGHSSQWESAMCHQTGPGSPQHPETLQGAIR